jgi:hypothetical protein
MSIPWFDGMQDATTAPKPKADAGDTTGRKASMIRRGCWCVCESPCMCILCFTSHVGSNDIIEVY